MSVRMKLTHAKTGSRRAHHRAVTKTLTKGSAGVRVRHHVDLATGMYRGKQILGTATPIKKGNAAKRPSKDSKTPAKS